jgi:uncharacterized protein (DUF433 family)
MAWEDRIAVDSEVLTGKPVIRGTRLAVEFILDLLGQGWSEEQILQNYPVIHRDDIRACLLYARDMFQAGRVYPLSA